MGIKKVLSSPRSPWQHAFVERMIGPLRRECLDHIIVFNEASLYRHVKLFLAYYHESRKHLSLAKGGIQLPMSEFWLNSNEAPPRTDEMYSGDSGA
jgi:transposase InsO family protein